MALSNGCDMGILIKDEIYGILAQLKHLTCEIKEIIDNVEKLIGDNDDNKRVIHDTFKGDKGDKADLRRLQEK